jgi:hypothetical protein
LLTLIAIPRLKHIAQAQVIADCCNTILDNKEAIAQGAVDGVVGIVQYMCDHTVETALTVYAAGVMVPSAQPKMTLEALGYTYNRLSRVDYKTLTTQKVFDKAQNNC